MKLEGQPIPGEVIEIKDTEAIVAFGQLITNVKLVRLEKMSKKEIKKEMKRETEVSKILSERLRKKKLDFTPNIDVRGLRAEEALIRVVAHIDEALMCGVNQVKILHGKGTGILRQMIRQTLSTMLYVKSYADEQIQFGGSGITVVNLE